MLRVEACSFYEEGVGFTCACVSSPEGETSVQGWVVGMDGCPMASPLEYIMEASAFHALRLILERALRPGFSAGLIRVMAGDALFCRRMDVWFFGRSADTQCGCA